MTKRELAALLQHLPDDCEVLVDTGEDFLHIVGLNEPHPDFGLNQVALVHEGTTRTPV